MSGWQPVSPCGDGCLPQAGSLPAVGGLQRALRFAAVVVVLLAGLLLVAVLPVLPARRREQALRAWFRGLLGALRIRLEVSGGDRFAPRGAAALVVSNHVSWLDLVALNAVQPLRMVAKAEIGGWPVVGALARRNRTIFVHRERLTRLPASVAAVSGALRGGASVGVFPEGTTWCGMSSGHFRPAFFQAAVDSATPVRPVALRYRLGAGTTAGTTTVAAFVGSTTLWDAILTLVRVRGLRIELRLLPVLTAQDTDRRALAADAEAAVTAAAAPLVPTPADPSAEVRERTGP